MLLNNGDQKTVIIYYKNYPSQKYPLQKCDQ